jgi:stalled ribosome rescue protein Dom34
MSIKNGNQFGVWMDSHHATIVGRESNDSDSFSVLAHLKNKGAASNSNEKSANNQQISLSLKFFKEIAAKMVNLVSVHVTGTGQAQEQFIKFLATTPQYKHAVATECTSNRMSDKQLVDFITKRFS